MHILSDRPEIEALKHSKVPRSQGLGAKVWNRVTPRVKPNFNPDSEPNFIQP